tara:strand:+ start:15770 stop:17272 length:1503 start_codon:yes stop_codon:yes gene_type:complete
MSSNKNGELPLAIQAQKGVDHSLTRRDVLRNGGYLLMGSALTACGESSDTQISGDPTAHAQDLAGDLYEQGSVPITTSGWTKTRGTAPDYPALEQDLTADVVVVGAGLAGSSLALHLTELGLSTVVLEMHQPGWGASGRNAGHVLPLLRDMSVFESFPDQGRAFFELFREHHGIPFEIAQRYNIDCDATQSGYLNAMTSQSAFEKFRASSAQPADKLGQNLQVVDADAMLAMTGSNYYSHGVLYPSGGRINPYLFTAGMSAAARARGARIFGDTEVTSLSQNGDDWRVRVQNGSTVRCKRVVFCTNAYATDVVPELRQSCYPMTAYALSSEPLPQELREQIMPSRATLAQVPFDLNPFLIDGHDRIITASMPSRSKPWDADWHFQQHLAWIHRTWPVTREFPIKLQAYWTGKVAMRQQEFPGMYEMTPGVYGLMHFNAWGNVMAPLMGMALATAIARDRLDQLPFPIERPQTVSNPGKQEFLIRTLMIPAARMAQRLGIL